MRTRNVRYTSVKSTNRGKPNEDYLCVDSKNQIYMVCDGITRTDFPGTYPDPSPSAEVAKLFADTVYLILLQNISHTDTREMLLDAIRHCNGKLRLYNERMFPQTDYLGNDYAGLVFIIGIIRKGFFNYAYLGDCSCLCVREDEIELVTELQTENIRKFRENYGYGIDATLTIRKDFRNNPLHSNGYGAITGEPLSLEFVRMKKLEITSCARIILMSDGLFDLYRLNPKTFHHRDTEDIILAASALEESFNFRSDDKSIIILD